ncbi:unnamed protein product [Brassica napus]|nr:unnamed protein product [Brassica napus]
MKRKFVVTPPANVTETLLSKNPILCSKTDSPTVDSPTAVSEVVVKPGSSVNIEIPASETRDLFLSLIHEQGETKASEDDTQSSKVFVKLITGAK